MISAAFYAPMKSPNDPVPSGDRSMARALLQALAEAGLDTTLASELRSRDSKGNPARQAELMALAKLERERLVQQGRAAGWQLWISYHNYYKAPDLLGPATAAALGIPYVLIESTRARKRLDGPWARFARAAEAATDAAAIVFCLTEHDAEALHKYRPAGQVIAPLHPFLPVKALPPETTRESALLSVGMMRAGDKSASYGLIAETMAYVQKEAWHLMIAGDGPARAEVEQLMARFGTRVRFLGALSGKALQQAYGSAGLFFWPGVNEAFGMAYLEAQAAGLTVVAQDRPGVRDVLAPGASYPAVEQGPRALAARLDLLLASPKLTTCLGKAARAHVAKHHLLGPASARLKSVLSEVLS
ncbi:MAG: glycosyltransferase family 4 protein [Pseudomonadota bacterium]